MKIIITILFSIQDLLLKQHKIYFSGSHAALTCHIVVMRHRVTGVVSVGHFDNFCCWQFGDESSAHKDGIDIMLEELGKLYIIVLIFVN